MVGTGERVAAVVSMRSMGGKSVFDPDGPITAARVGAFASTLDDARHVAGTLIRLGFEITHFHPIAISFSGTPAQFGEHFGIRLEKSTRPGGRGRMIDVHAPIAEDAPRLLDLPAAFDGRAEGIAIACPPRLVDDAGLPVRDLAIDREAGRCLPDELAMSIWGEGLTGLDATGDGVVAAQIGTGHYRHRFFAERRYRVLPTLLGPGRSGSLQDEHGHGTGEAACLFAAAPNLRLRPVKGLLDPVGDLLMTIDSFPKPDLIVNSWGYDVDQLSWPGLKADNPNLHNYLRLLEAAIAQATAQGIVVTAAAPRGWQSFPASHPEVIAIAAAAAGGRLTFGGEPGGGSGLYPGRLVPDFWSRAGGAERPGGDGHLGFLQPSQPGSDLCRMRDLATAPDDDGWACSDLDQASIPLAVSMIAVLMERHRGLPTVAIKALMAKAAEDLATAGQTRTEAFAVNDHGAALAASVEQGAVKVGAMG